MFGSLESPTQAKVWYHMCSVWSRGPSHASVPCLLRDGRWQVVGCVQSLASKRLKNALFRSAWVASCHGPLLKAYYDRKRAEGKRHNATVMCLARRRLNVLFAMVKTGALYEEKTPVAA